MARAWFAALLLGALTPAVITTAFFADVWIFPWAFAVTLAHAIVLGLPAALFYRARRWYRLEAALVGSALIGAIPGGIITLPDQLSPGDVGAFNGAATLIGGVLVPVGYLEVLAALAGLGASGGLVFWLTLRWFGALTAADQKQP